MIKFKPIKPTKQDQEYSEYLKKCNEGITKMYGGAVKVKASLLPRIPLAHKVCPMQLMPITRADAILYKMHKLMFQQCQDFRG